MRDLKMWRTRGTQRPIILQHHQVIHPPTHAAALRPVPSTSTKALLPSLPLLLHLGQTLSSFQWSTPHFSLARFLFFLKAQDCTGFQTAQPNTALKTPSFFRNEPLSSSVSVSAVCHRGGVFWWEES
ncbi:hypothetical protein ANANG_G00027780 [Anguilla anguilla]|uniref:Uncharacterized protein n=1 Tax=Anguilla anguilla TaxID=7936 RepID=A0A9D3MRA1_ANGAN|nr:hypothetical protein ANANG_G00027780 [Anguilla anguilla]